MSSGDADGELWPLSGPLRAFVLTIRTGVCDPDSGECVDTALADGTSCADGNTCNGAELCQAGVCKSGTELACDDHNPCTADACDATSGCAHTLIDGCMACESDADCQEDDRCNGEELCSAGTCVKGTPPDVCEPASGPDAGSEAPDAGSEEAPKGKQKSDGCSVGAAGADANSAWPALLLLLGLALPWRRKRAQR